MSQSYNFPCGCSFQLTEAGTPTFDIENIPYNCKATWDLLGRGETKGIFQLESPLGRQWTKELKPEHLEHIGALGSILRPGVLKSYADDGLSMTKHYCMRKNNEEPCESIHAALKPILSNSYEILIYQEQIMRIAADIAGFDKKMVDKIRKAVGKKVQSEIAEVGKLFLEGVEKTGVVSKEIGEKIWNNIKESGRYAFNKCLSGDTIIRRAQKSSHQPSFSIKELFYIKNDINYAKQTGHLDLYKQFKFKKSFGNSLSLSSDGRLYKNKIIDIQKAGIQIVYLVTLENGSNIKCTLNHKFPTQNGEKQLSELSIGDSLICCGEYEKSNFAILNKFSNLEISDLRNRSVNHDGKTEGFMCGVNNPGYTNGSYTEFQINKQKIPMVCAKCGTKNKRLETHHKDRNRENSKLENLERLCASCHKLSEYELGRKRKGEKGYPSYYSKIKSIVIYGAEEVFNVEMEGPNHNFVVNNNIVTSNSHAYSYGITGYQCAYIKAHFPLAFFTAWLLHANKKSKPLEEIFELINDAKRYDIDVEPPDLLSMQKNFHTDGKLIKFGLGDIKGVGEKQIDKLALIEKKSMDLLSKPLASANWYEFLLFYSDSISSGVFTSLASVGALRWLNYGRQLMIHEYEIWNNLTDKEKEWIRTNYRSFTSLTEAIENGARTKKSGGACSNKNRVSVMASYAQSLKNPPTVLIDTPAWIAGQEERFLGIALSCSKTDSCDISAVNTSCKDYLAGKTGFMIFCVEIQRMAEITTKRGKTPGAKMARLTIADNSCSIEAVVFPDVYAEYNSLLTEKNLVVINAERSKKKNDDTLIVKRVWQASQQG